MRKQHERDAAKPARFQTYLHDDTASRSATDVDVEENLGVSHVEWMNARTHCSRDLDLAFERKLG